MTPAFISNANAFATTHEVTAYAPIRIGSDTRPLHQVREDIDVILQLVESIIILAIILDLGQHIGIDHIIFKEFPQLVVLLLIARAPPHRVTVLYAYGHAEGAAEPAILMQWIIRVRLVHVVKEVPHRNVVQVQHRFRLDATLYLDA